VYPTVVVAQKIHIGINVGRQEKEETTRHGKKILYTRNLGPRRGWLGKKGRFF